MRSTPPAPYDPANPFGNMGMPAKMKELNELPYWEKELAAGWTQERKEYIEYLRQDANSAVEEKYDFEAAVCEQKIIFLQSLSMIHSGFVPITSYLFDFFPVFIFSDDDEVYRLLRFSP